MSKRFFDTLELDLAGLTRQGAHVEPDAHSRLIALGRRSITIMALAVVLAVSFVSEFPGTANGLPIAAAVAVTHAVPATHLISHA
jgi:hypothetical protein